MKEKETDPEAKAQMYLKWQPSKELSRLIGKLARGDVALQYARRVIVHNDYHTLKKYIKRRYSTSEAPDVAHRQLSESFWLAKVRSYFFLGKEIECLIQTAVLMGLKRFSPSLLGIFQCERVF